MWFALSFHERAPPLRCLIGRDGLLYWRLVDVGRLLKRTNPYEFANAFDYTLAELVLPSDFNFPKSTLRSKVADTQMVCEILKQKDVRLADTFNYLISEGKFVVINESARYLFHFKNCVTLQASQYGNVTFSEWVTSFITDTLNIRLDALKNGEFPNVEQYDTTTENTMDDVFDGGEINSNMQEGNFVWQSENNSNMQEGNFVLQPENNSNVHEGNHSNVQEENLFTPPQNNADMRGENFFVPHDSDMQGDSPENNSNERGELSTKDHDSEKINSPEDDAVVKLFLLYKERLALNCSKREIQTRLDEVNIKIFALENNIQIVTE